MDTPSSSNASQSARPRRMSSCQAARGLLMLLALPCLAWGEPTLAQGAVDAPATAALQQRAEATFTSTLAARSSAVETTLNADQQRIAAPSLAGAANADAQGRPFAQSAEFMLHRWVNAGRAALGVGVGAIGMMPAGGAQWTNFSPLVSVGARYRMAREATLYADASRLAPQPVAAAYGEQETVRTRVGLEFKGVNTARSLGLERGAIGMQLQSGYRLQLRPRKGGVAVYLRGQF